MQLNVYAIERDGFPMPVEILVVAESKEAAVIKAAEALRKDDSVEERAERYRQRPIRVVAQLSADGGLVSEYHHDPEHWSKKFAEGGSPDLSEILAMLGSGKVGVC